MHRWGLFFVGLIGWGICEPARAADAPLFEVVAKEKATPNGRRELTFTLVNRSGRSIEGARIELASVSCQITSSIHVSKFPDGVITKSKRVPIPGVIGVGAGDRYVARVAWVRFADGAELQYPGRDSDTSQ